MTAGSRSKQQITKLPFSDTQYANDIDQAFRSKPNGGLMMVFWFDFVEVKFGNFRKFTVVA